MTKMKFMIAVMLGFSPFAVASEDLEKSHLLLSQGKKLEALEFAQQALKSSDDKAQSQLQIARIYIQLGELIEAEDLINEVRVTGASDQAMLVTIQNELGAVYSQRGDYELAVEQYQAGLDLARKSSLDDVTIQRVLVNLLNATHDAEKSRSIAGVTEQVLANAQQGALDDADSLIATAAALHRTSPDDQKLRVEALNMLSRAYGIAARNNDLRGASLALGLQAALYESENRVDEALRLTELALLHAQEANSLETLYRWHAQVGRLLLAQGNSEASEAAYRTALDVLSGIRRDLPASSPKVFGEQVLPVYNGYADVLLRKASAAKGREQKNALLSEVVDTLEELKQAEVEDYFAKACVVEETLDWSSFLTGSAIVYPVFLDDRTEIILETEAGYSQHVIDVGREEMTATIRQFRLEVADFDNYEEDYFETGEILEEWLIDPLEPTLNAMNVNTLVFVPDGPLRTIPMAALYDGEEFLIERYALASTPAISLTKSSLAQEESSALVGGITEGVQGFSPLSFVDPELEQVSTLLNESKLQDQSFLLDEVEQRFEGNQYSIVHFATHGTFSSDFRKSFVLTYDGKLTMGRLENALDQQQGLDMLVLSACETAAGDDRAALGLAGVAIQAGAASALASLWAISDEGTASLIPEFYKGILENNLSKAESLRQAQVKLLKDPRFDHPVFWAPYLLIGNWI